MAIRSLDEKRIAPVASVATGLSHPHFFSVFELLSFLFPCFSTASEDEAPKWATATLHAYYQQPTRGQITASRCEAAPGRETRRADRRAGLPHPPSLSHS